MMMMMMKYKILNYNWEWIELTMTTKKKTLSTGNIHFVIKKRKEKETLSFQVKTIEPTYKNKKIKLLIFTHTMLLFWSDDNSDFFLVLVLFRPPLYFLFLKIHLFGSSLSNLNTHTHTHTLNFLKQSHHHWHDDDDEIFYVFFSR